MKVLFSVLICLVVLVLIPCLSAVAVVGVVPFIFYLILQLRYEYKGRVKVAKKPCKKSGVETLLDMYKKLENDKKV